MDDLTLLAGREENPSPAGITAAADRGTRDLRAVFCVRRFRSTPPLIPLASYRAGFATAHPERYVAAGRQWRSRV
jgi:hypothetical protein